MSTLSAGHVSSGHLLDPRGVSLLESTSQPFQSGISQGSGRAGWSSAATGLTTASSGVPILNSSSPRTLSSAAHDSHNLLSDTRTTMDDNHGQRMYNNQRRPATGAVPPYPSSTPSGYQQQQPHQQQQQHQQHQQGSYLPSPGHTSPASSLPPHPYPAPSSGHHQPPVSMSASTSSYHLPSTGSQYPSLQQHHHPNHHPSQQHQPGQLPSPTQHSPQTGSVGSASDYSQHGGQSTSNYSLSSSSPYPMMGQQTNPYRPPGNFYGQPMHMQGPPIGGMHHPQGPMGMMPPHMGHPYGHYMYAAAPGQQQMDRPFKCDQCTQSFSRNHDLKRHKRIHLAVKPFPCNYCSKQFSRKDALKRHRLVKGCEEKAKAAERDNKNGTQRNGGEAAENSPRETASDSGSNDDGLASKSEHISSPQASTTQTTTQLDSQAPPQINSQLGSQVQPSLLNPQLGNSQVPLQFHSQPNGQAQNQGGLDHQNPMGM